MKNRIINNLCDPRRRHLVQFAATIAMTLLVGTMSFVFADSDGVAGAIKSLMNSFYGTILKSAVVVVPVYLAVVGLTMVFGGKNAVENARKGFLIGAAAILLVYGAPVLVATIVGILNSNGIGGNSSFSSLDPDMVLPAD